MGSVPPCPSFWRWDNTRPDGAPSAAPPAAPPTLQPWPGPLTAKCQSCNTQCLWLRWKEGQPRPLCPAGTMGLQRLPPPHTHLQERLVLHPHAVKQSLPDLQQLVVRETTCGGTSNTQAKRTQLSGPHCAALAHCSTGKHSGQPPPAPRPGALSTPVTAVSRFSKHPSIRTRGPWARADAGHGVVSCGQLVPLDARGLVPCPRLASNSEGET